MQTKGHPPLFSFWFTIELKSLMPIHGPRKELMIILNRFKKLDLCLYRAEQYTKVNNQGVCTGSEYTKRIITLLEIFVTSTSKPSFHMKIKALHILDGRICTWKGRPNLFTTSWVYSCAKSVFARKTPSGWWVLMFTLKLCITWGRAMPLQFHERSFIAWGW